MRIHPRTTHTLTLGAALASAMLATGCSSVSNALSGDKIDYRSSGAQSVRLDVPPEAEFIFSRSEITNRSAAANASGRSVMGTLTSVSPDGSMRNSSFRSPSATVRVPQFPITSLSSP